MTDTNSLRTGAGYALEVGLYATHKAMIEAADTIDTLRQALIKCKQQASIMRIWNGMGWTYHPPQAKRIYEAAEAALAATKTGEQHDNFCT